MRKAAVLALGLATTLLTASPLVDSRATAATTTAPTLAGRLASVKTAKQINYYPSANGWTRMWTSFDAATINADLAKARAMGADSVRAIIFPSVFGYPTPKPEYTSKLAQFVTMAGTNGLTVKLTLFDWWNGYTDIAGSSAWAKAIVSPYRDDKRVISIGLQNELDPADPAAVAWAKKLVPVLRAAAPAVPVTIAMSGAAGSAGMAKIKTALAATPLDYYDYHFYGNSENALALIRQAQAAVAPAPVVLGETGVSTQATSEGEQAAYLARVFQAAAVAGVRSVAPWTLYDFRSGAIPTSAVAKIPSQYAFGLHRTDGTAKPAAAVVKAAWTGTAYPSSVLDLGFENAAGQTPWSTYLPELGAATKVQGAARTGKWSVRLTNTGKNSSGSPSYRVAPVVPVEAGKTWRAEAYARGTAATGATQVALSWFDVNGRWLGGASSATLPAGTTGWTKLTVSSKAPTGAAGLQVHLKSGDNKGTVWFDDVTMSAS
ncbi:cellulase family glycosylhydrolase [Paractinoplanes atraurantiacus]|uniref:Cellulase (Glycosyl hydrolase family 5) n=1 Tax=Paractinoplanes atraurantiacus TaxID=1036182 RepID=A0A285GPI4_9ACTN|nr:cellulase family glycosylhydrolase [Actinoplanes atraurantiacus]SNY24251.1 Cellulase (glycosyl hydrolase family 5) [Actinoplanes atraurantiacus]